MTSPLDSLDWTDIEALNQPLPPPPPSPTKKAGLSPQRTAPLSLSAKVAIAVSVVLVFSALAGFLIYWFVFHHRTTNTPGGQGTNKFGTLSVTDTSTRTQPGIFAPGDTLEITYTPSSLGFSHRAVFTVSFDGGKTFPTTLSDPSFANAVQWVIPETVFTAEAVFQVHDAVTPADYINTTPLIVIQPPFVLTTGPGLSRAGDIVYVNQPVVCTLSIDTDTPGLTATGFVVQLSADPSFKTGVTSAVLQTSVINPAQQQATLTWVVAQPLNQAYYRVSTTGLVAAQQPYELSATSPRTIQIAVNDSCEDKADDGSSFVLCQLTMTSSSTGVGGNFTPNSGVTLYLAYRHTYPGSTAFTYSVAGGPAQPWTVTFSRQTDTLLIFVATLPDLVTTAFTVTAVSGHQTQTSDPYALVPALALQIPALTSFSVTQYHSSITNFSATVVMDPPTYRPTTWQMGYQQANGSGTVLWPASNVTSVSYAGGVASLVWVMDWADFGASGPVGQLTRRLVVAADQGAVENSVPVLFNLVSYAPTFYPLLSVPGGVGLPICQYLVTSNDNAVVTFCRDGLSSLVGTWPDPAGSNNIYVLVNDAENQQIVWWGSLLQHQDISVPAPLAPNPVNYVNAVRLPGPALSAPPAGAQLFGVARAEGLTLRFLPASHPTQILYADNCSSAFQGLYAYDAGTSPDQRSQFYWNQQRLPPY